MQGSKLRLRAPSIRIVQWYAITCKKTRVGNCNRRRAARRVDDDDFVLDYCVRYGALLAYSFVLTYNKLWYYLCESISLDSCQVPPVTLTSALQTCESARSANSRPQFQTPRTSHPTDATHFGRLTGLREYSRRTRTSALDPTRAPPQTSSMMMTVSSLLIVLRNVRGVGGAGRSMFWRHRRNVLGRMIPQGGSQKTL